MDTIKILKGNVELDVPADQKERYMRLGYSVVDNEGHIIEEAPLQDIGALQGRVAELLSENSALKAEIAKLKKPQRTQKAEKAE